MINKNFLSESNNNKSDILLISSNIILSYLHQLTAEIDGVISNPEEIEYIHKMRVASRRLRVSLAVFKDFYPQSYMKQWTKKIKKITKVLGPARDIDIQIEFLTKYIESISLSDKKNKPGLSRMLWRLKHKRNKSQIKLNKTLNDFKKSNFINDFQKKLNLTVLKNQIKKIENSGDAKVSKKIFEQSSSLTGKQQMLNSLKEVILKSAVIKNINLSENDLSANNTNTEFYSADKILDSSFIFENADALHILRKSIKTLRYQMEIFNFYFDNIFDKNIKTIKDMQTILGDIHDCDVWIGLLPVFLKKEKKRTLKYFGNTRNFYKLQNGAVNLFNDRIIKRNLLYSELLKLWNDFELTGFFDKLKNKIIKFKHKN